MYEQLQDLAVQQRVDSREAREKYLKDEISLQIREAMRPVGIDQRPMFPDDWLSREDRADSLLNEVPVPRWQREIEDRLNNRLSVALVDLPAGEAFDFVAQRLGLNLVVSPDIRLDALPVSLRAVNMRGANVLQWLCDQLETRWQLIDEAVYIGSDRVAELVTHAYNMDEVLYQPPNLIGPELGTFQSDSGASFNFDQSEEIDDLAIEDVVDLIQEVVQPTVWDLDGYGIGIHQRLLFVTADYETHAQVREFIRQQANVSNAQVALDLRWLDIGDDFLEEIGVNWGGGDVLQPPTTPGYRDVQPEWSVVGSLLNALPGAATNALATGVNGGLQLQWAHIGRLRLNAILQAIETKQKGRVLEAVQLTVLNGRRGNAFLGNQISYISGNEASGDTDAGLPDITVDTINVGVSIDVQPFISADRKYVTLDLRPIATTVDFTIENITYVANINGFVFQTQVPIELPNIAGKSSGTRVMIPDRGSILVGGLDEALDQKSKSGVPLFSHIPFVGRLFGRRGLYSVRQSLMLSIGARIVLNDEEAALQ